MDSKARRILLVDDEPWMLRACVRTLSELPVQIDSATGAEEALRSLEKEPAAVLIADQRMPGLQGTILLEEVHRRWPQTVGVLMTAYADPAVLKEALRRGRIYRLLAKPFKEEDLRRVVTEALEHHARITGLQRTQECSLHSFEHMFRHASEAMLIIDQDGSVVAANPAFLSLLVDAPPETSNALKVFPHVIPEGRFAWEDLRAAIAEQGTWSQEVTRGDYHGLLSISAISDAAGHPYAYAAVEQEITARKRHQDAQDQAQYALIFALTKAAENRDPDTGLHLERIRRYSVVLAEELAAGSELPAGTIDSDFVHALSLASPLHDVGKIGLPEAILLKPGQLDPHEVEAVRRHPEIGAKLLAGADEALPDNSWLRMARTIALSHHERFDGTGYPRGLKGAEIDLGARIVALVDAYDTITGKRCYKLADSHEEAKRRICDGSGTHFDPDLVAAFLRCEGEFLKILDEVGDARGDDPDA